MSSTRTDGDRLAVMVTQAAGAQSRQITTGGGESSKISVTEQGCCMCRYAIWLSARMRVNGTPSA